MVSANRIYSRTGHSDLAAETYARLIAVFTLLLAVCTAWGAYVSSDWAMSWLLLIGTLVVAIASIFVFEGSSNPIISGAGVSVMSFMMGLMMGPVISLYEAHIVLQAVLLTGLIVGFMSVMGMMFPKLFLGLGVYVMPALILLIVGGLSQPILLAFGVPYENMSTFNYLLTWAGIIVFTVIVAYDWSRAMEMPYTVDNSIDASGGIILDAINIFIRLLPILGGQKPSNK